MKKSLIPVMLFISIVLLLPLPWYNDMYGNPFTYKIEDMSGFQVFLIKYPIIYSYFVFFSFLVGRFHPSKDLLRLGLI